MRGTYLYLYLFMDLNCIFNVPSINLKHAVFRPAYRVYRQGLVFSSAIWSAGRLRNTAPPRSEMGSSPGETTN